MTDKQFDALVDLIRAIAERAASSEAHGNCAGAHMAAEFSSWKMAKQLFCAHKSTRRQTSQSDKSQRIAKRPTVERLGAHYGDTPPTGDEESK